MIFTYFRPTSAFFGNFQQYYLYQDSSRSFSNHFQIFSDRFQPRNLRTIVDLDKILFLLFVSILIIQPLASHDCSSFQSLMTYFSCSIKYLYHYLEKQAINSPQDSEFSYLQKSLCKQVGCYSFRFLLRGINWIPLGLPLYSILGTSHLVGTLALIASCQQSQHLVSSHSITLALIVSHRQTKHIVGWNSIAFVAVRSLNPLELIIKPADFTYSAVGMRING